MRLLGSIDFYPFLMLAARRGGRFRLGVQGGSFFLRRIPTAAAFFQAMRAQVEREGEGEGDDPRAPAMARLERLAWRHAPVLAKVYCRAVPSPTAAQYLKLLRLVGFDPVCEHL